MKRKFMFKLVLPIAALAAMLVPAAASAHVFVTPTEAPNEGDSVLQFTVPHGCDGAATNGVTIKMPPQVIAATPESIPGWTVKTKTGKLPQPAVDDGEKITEGVREVSWTGGNLPDGQFLEFGLSVATSGDVGDTAEFKVLQDCVGGAQTAWIQKTVEGQEEPEHPAPTVTLVAAEDGGHSHGSMSDSGSDSASAEPAATETSASDSDSDDDSGNGLSIAALIVGALGLIAGGTALVASRRKA